MSALDEARSQIDKIDQEVARLYEARMDAVSKVVAYKKENNLPVLDSSREEIILNKNEAYIKNEEYKSFYKDFMKDVMKNSREYQAYILSKDSEAK